MENKLEKYSTAYSPLYKQFVEIIKVRIDADGQPIIHARLAHSNKTVLFRETELTRYCL